MEHELEAELKGAIADFINKIVKLFKVNLTKKDLDQQIKQFYNKGLGEIEVQFNLGLKIDSNEIKFLQQYTYDNIKGFTEEMREKLRKELSQGLLNNVSQREIIKNVSDILELSKTRAAMIVKTETSRAYNAGQYTAAKNTGLKLMKEWSAQREKINRRGNKVPCPICEELHGQRVGMNEKFKLSDGTEYLMPPTHPNCACSVLFVPMEKSDKTE